jgi:hypothetical protein
MAILYSHFSYLIYFSYPFNTKQTAVHCYEEIHPSNFQYEMKSALEELLHQLDFTDQR